MSISWLTVLIVCNLGRSWGIQELRERSWEDLHGLWHVCVRERNRIATSDLERSRLKAGYGDYESEGRDKVVSYYPLIVYQEQSFGDHHVAPE